MALMSEDREENKINLQGSLDCVIEKSNPYEEEDPMGCNLGTHISSDDGDLTPEISQNMSLSCGPKNATTQLQSLLANRTGPYNQNSINTYM